MMRNSVRTLVRLRCACARSYSRGGNPDAAYGAGTVVIQRGMMAKASATAAAAAAGGGKKGGDGGRGGAKTKGGSDEHGLGVIPINYLKDGEDPPLKPDGEYPEWLFKMKMSSLARLRRKKEEDYTMEEFRRFVQLDAREKIKRQNRSGKF